MRYLQDLPTASGPAGQRALSMIHPNRSTTITHHENEWGFTNNCKLIINKFGDGFLIYKCTFITVFNVRIINIILLNREIGVVFPVSKSSMRGNSSLRWSVTGVEINPIMVNTFVSSFHSLPYVGFKTVSEIVFVFLDCKLLSFYRFEHSICRPSYHLLLSRNYWAF